MGCSGQGGETSLSLASILEPILVGLVRRLRHFYGFQLRASRPSRFLRISYFQFPALLAVYHDSPGARKEGYFRCELFGFKSRVTVVPPTTSSKKCHAIIRYAMAIFEIASHCICSGTTKHL
jgi:hypothetical protein